jgi:hypothetical protein
VVEDCSRNLYDQTSRENIGSELLRQMIKTSGGSLNLVRDPSGCTTEMFSSDVSNVYYMPFDAQVLVIFIGLFYIHRIVTFVPTYAFDNQPNLMLCYDYNWSYDNDFEICYTDMKGSNFQYNCLFQVKIHIFSRKVIPGETFAIVIEENTVYYQFLSLVCVYLVLG